MPAKYDSKSQSMIRNSGLEGKQGVAVKHATPQFTVDYIRQACLQTLYVLLR